METCIGHVTHYYNRLGVAVLSLSREIKINDILHFCSHNNDFYQKALSMQIEHSPIQLAGPGHEVAIKVVEPVHQNDKVFLVIESTPEEGEMILLQQLREWEEKI